MFKQVTRPLILGVLASLALSLSACGGDSGKKTVAVVGETKLSQATLSHWMRTVFGGDYRIVFSKTAPEGFVSDPPDYPRCVSAARRIAPKDAGKPRLSDAQLLVKCRQLHNAIKEQALDWLLSILWRTEEGAELGSPASEAEVTHRLREFTAKEYHSPAQFNKMLAGNHRTLADERLLLRRNILEGRFLARLKAHAAKLGGDQKTKVKLVLENNAKWTARTDCSPGYLAWECKQYGSSKPASPSVAIVLENLSKGV